MAQLSEYERQRLANIERNNSVLDALGLLNKPLLTACEPKPKPKPPPKDKEDSGDVPLEPTRRSDRVSKKPALFNGLTDAYFNSEEKDSDDDETRTRFSERPKRSMSAAMTYAQEFHMEPDTKRRMMRRPDVSVRATTTFELTAASPDMPLQFTQPKSLPVCKMVEGTSRTPCVRCPRCYKQILVRAPERLTGFVYLQKHDPCGVDVRVA